MPASTVPSPTSTARSRRPRSSEPARPLPCRLRGSDAVLVALDARGNPGGIGGEGSSFAWQAASGLADGGSGAQGRSSGRARWSGWGGGERPCAPGASPDLVPDSLDSRLGIDSRGWHQRVVRRAKFPPVSGRSARRSAGRSDHRCRAWCRSVCDAWPIRLLSRVSLVRSTTMVARHGRAKSRDMKVVCRHCSSYLGWNYADRSASAGSRDTAGRQVDRRAADQRQ